MRKLTNYFLWFVITLCVFSQPVMAEVSLSGTVGEISDSDASYGGYYLRYTGSPAPSGYSHAYQWGSPYLSCDPNNTPVTFNGTINVGEMTIGAVSFVGLLDQGLLEEGKTGYQGGAYAYIFKMNASTVRIGPTDGNLGGEIVQVFKDYSIPIDGLININIEISFGTVTIKVGSDTPISDAYGFIKVLGNANANGYYPWDEFAYGAIVGWDNFLPATQMAYNLTVTGCQQKLGSCVVDIDNVNKQYTLLSDCTTDKTIFIEDGWTLDGGGFTITAIDPEEGHFLGGVLSNMGDTVHIKNVNITSDGLANVCDGGFDRLRGILLEAGGGSITNVHVYGVRQGPSGCQEGNAIEVRNFDETGNPATDQVSVTISGNWVSNYQKNGITVNGNVAASITDNVINGDGQIDYIAQNGVQVGFGATAEFISNTITGNWYTPKDWLACGLLVYQATGVRQQKNLFSDNEKDLCNFGRGGGNFNSATE